MERIMIHLDREICSSFESSTTREWLETNGIGGYASSTVSSANTRRYHGLLVAATRPPLGRMVLLSKFEETLTIDGESFELSCNQYPGAIYPEGYRYLNGFRLDPFPVWTFEVNGVVVEKSVFMASGENTTVCQWKVIGGNEGDVHSIGLELKPLIAFRDHHHLRHDRDGFDETYDTGIDEAENVVAIAPVEGMPTLFFAHNADSVEKQGHW